MVKSEQQRQKKLARRKTKEKQKKQQLARQKQQLTSLAGKMSVAAKGHILDCMAGPFEDGMSTILLSRQAPGGQVAIAIFLLDLYCLGVKNTIADYWTPVRYREMRDNLIDRHRLQPIQPGVARGVVEAAVQYAASFGFAPHADYPKMLPIWDDIEPESVEGLVEFGKEGKPFYVNGPHDDETMQRLVLQQLKKSVGEGNYHFMVGGPQGPSMNALDFDDLEFLVSKEIEEEEEEDEAGSLTLDGKVTSRRIDAAE